MHLYIQAYIFSFTLQQLLQHVTLIQLSHNRWSNESSSISQVGKPFIAFYKMNCICYGMPKKTTLYVQPTQQLMADWKRNCVLLERTWIKYSCVYHTWLLLPFAVRNEMVFHSRNTRGSWRIVGGGELLLYSFTIHMMLMDFNNFFLMYGNQLLLLLYFKHTKAINNYNNNNISKKEIRNFSRFYVKLNFNVERNLESGESNII